MRAIIIPILIIALMAIASAATPRISTLSTYANTLGAGSSDTVTLPTVVLAGDSIGLQIEFASDSINGKVLYRYKSQSGYYDSDLAGAATYVSWNNSTENIAVFTNQVPVSAGAYSVEFYLIITNSNYNTKTITGSIYKIIWN